MSDATEVETSVTEEAPPTKYFTGYACAKVVNNELKQMGLDAIPPQMVYQYIAKGYIKSEVDGEGKKKVSEVELAKWFNKYATKKGALAAAKTTLVSKEEPKSEDEATEDE